MIGVAPIADVGAIQPGALRENDGIGQDLLTAGRALVNIGVESESGFIGHRSLLMLPLYHS
ncbi:hypothetical protein CMI47_08015 [Candidatus Pacearchaeota archaeon]|nr:hypothetical protein [Candidatus Pacearchaeota archaeon]